jgi:hypothetical protein
MSLLRKLMMLIEWYRNRHGWIWYVDTYLFSPTPLGYFCSVRRLLWGLSPKPGKITSTK